MLKELRSLSGAPLMKCKEALEKKSDLQEALQYLKENNLIMAEKHANRAQNEGVLVYTENENRFQILKIKTETDFVSNNQEFLNFSRIIGDNTINQKVLQDGNHEINDDVLKNLSNEKDLLYEQKQITAKIQENIKVTDLFQRTLKSNEAVGVYVHDRLNNGIESNFQSKERLKGIGRDLAVHVMCNQPLYISEQDVPEETKNEIMQRIKEELQDDKKPEHIKEKIIQGKYNKILKDDVLMNQDIYWIHKTGWDRKIPFQDCLKEIEESLGEKVSVKEFNTFKLKQLILINEAIKKQSKNK